MNGGYRFIKEDGLRRVIRSALPEGERRTNVLTAVDRWLARQPMTPRLVGTTAAAKILGIHAPHVTRLKEQDRMPEAVPVEGSADVYVREQVEDLGRELEAERQARRARRRDREEVGA